MKIARKIVDEFLDIGIDSFGFYSPLDYLALEDLAIARDISPEKYWYGLLSKEIRIPRNGEDIISMGYKAAYNAIIRGSIKPGDIDAVFVGTETTVYAVKSISNIYKDLLGIPSQSFTQDVANACASATLAVLNAISMIEMGIVHCALVIAVDISSYEMYSSGEPTQGAGAVAMIIKREPRIIKFGKHFGKASGNISDFFRPANSTNAQVFGKYSIQSYLQLQLDAYDNLSSQVGDFIADYYVFHGPYAKLPLKFFQKLILERWLVNIDQFIKEKPKHLSSLMYKRYFDSSITTDYLIGEKLLNKLRGMNISQEQQGIYYSWIGHEIRHSLLPSLKVPYLCGNLYSASIWAQLMYLIEDHVLHAGDQIYFGSYGSGAIAISGFLQIQPGIKQKNRLQLEEFLNSKNQIKMEQYEEYKKGINNQDRDIVWVKVEQYPDLPILHSKLRFCDKGCLLPEYKSLQDCPEGHTGNNLIEYPLIGKIEETQVYIPGDISPLFAGFAPIFCSKNELEKNYLHTVELDLIRSFFDSDSKMVKGLIQWIPSYKFAPNSPYLNLIENKETISNIDEKISSEH